MFEFESIINSQQCINVNTMLPSSEEQEAVFNITQAIDSIDNDKDSFAQYELNFSANDLLTIEYLKTASHYYGQSGKLSELEPSLTNFINSLTRDGNKDLAKNIIRHIDNMLRAIGYEYVNIKVTVNARDTSLQNIDNMINYIGCSLLKAIGYECTEVTAGYPSLWHIDKSFDQVVNKQNQEPHSHAFILTLRGDPTKFLPTDNKLRRNFHAIAEDSEFTYDVKESKIISVADLSTTVDVQSAVFMRSAEFGAIHAATEGEGRVVFVISPLLEKTCHQLNSYFDRIRDLELEKYIIAAEMPGVYYLRRVR